MLVRNAFPVSDAGEEVLAWLPLALRIALFVGFAAMSFAISRSARGIPGKRQITISAALVMLFALDTSIMAMAAQAGWSRPVAFDLIAWAIMGAGLSALFFLWVPHLSRIADAATGLCLPLSATAGAFICLALNMMDTPANALFLAVCALASLGLHAVLTRTKASKSEASLDAGSAAATQEANDARDAAGTRAQTVAAKQAGNAARHHSSARADNEARGASADAGRASRGESEKAAATSEPPDFIPAGMSSHAFAEQAQKIADALERDAIPFDTSRENAKLSWAFGVINVAYGVVFGLGAASITQIPANDGVSVGIAVAMIAGACAAYLFTKHAKGRVLQSSVLRMLFPVLVVALVPLSIFSGIVYLLCNLLLLASYVFLVTVSIAFELRATRERKASPLYFVGMSQTTLAAGLAFGFALGLLPSATGALDHTMLSMVSLGLVVLLAVFAAFTQGRMTADQAATDAEKIAQRITAERLLEEKLHADEHAGKGRWKSSCESVATAAGLSARETEVFMLLAKGRGIEHIQNKLCISGHTVKTHTYNIYRKMGIGSREELLDAIESVSSSKDNR